MNRQVPAVVVVPSLERDFLSQNFKFFIENGICIENRDFMKNEYAVIFICVQVISRKSIFLSEMSILIYRSRPKMVVFGQKRPIFTTIS